MNHLLTYFTQTCMVFEFTRVACRCSMSCDIFGAMLLLIMKLSASVL